MQHRGSGRRPHAKIPGITDTRAPTQSLSVKKEKRRRRRPAL